MPKKRAFEISPPPWKSKLLSIFLARNLRAPRRSEAIHNATSVVAEMSLPTIVKMEQGAPTVQIGYYARAAWLLDEPFPRVDRF